MNKSEEINVISSLKLPLIIGVVLIHCNLLVFVAHAGETLIGFRRFMLCWDYVLKLMVPAFFFISGYLFFRSGYLTSQSYIAKIKRRCRTLVIPYLLWNIIGMILTLLKTAPSLAPYFPQYQDSFESLFSVLRGFVAIKGSVYPYDMPLWFMRNLIFIVIASPLLSLLMRYLKWFAPVVCILCMLFFNSDKLGIFSSFYFFMLGGCASLCGLDFEKVSTKCCWFIVGFVVSGIGNFKWPEFFPPFVYQTFGVLSLMCVGFRFPLFQKEAPFLRKAQFFIYACHGLYASVVIKTVLKFLPVESSVMAFFDYLVIFVVNIGITLLLYMGFCKLSPRLMGILCGGRI